MLKTTLYFGILLFAWNCSDDNSVGKTDHTRNNNGGVLIINNDSGQDLATDQSQSDMGRRDTSGGAFCGDGIVQANEVCDGENCSADCQGVIEGLCGNGTLDAAENCDDGNVNEDDYCSADCQTITGVCGDNIKQNNETCDDGNTKNDDYCKDDCSAHTGECGDNIQQANEACDDGNQNPDDYCQADCKAIIGVCGDGQTQINEVCDDGNLVDNDYCKDDCLSVTGSCGDGTQQANEACDDGNQANSDYCNDTCSTITGSCGDGILQGNETCDDQVTKNCSSTHDGGAGVCVPQNTCSVGYILDQNGACITNNTTGLTTPCSNGSGFAIFKIHYDSGSSSARVDVWDASCTYSFVSNSACNVREVCRGFCDVPRTGGGNPIFNTSNYWRTRFNVNGLNFANATLWVQARGTRGSTRFRAWSPLYGEVISDLVNGFSYDWYSVDWSNYLHPNDQPSLTAIQIYGHNSNLAVQGVELCVE